MTPPAAITLCTFLLGIVGGSLIPQTIIPVCPETEGQKLLSTSIDLRTKTAVCSYAVAYGRPVKATPARVKRYVGGVASLSTSTNNIPTDNP